MPQVFKDLFGSEKAVVSILVIVAGSILFALGKLDAGQWKELVIWIAGIYLGAKSLQGAAFAIAQGKSDAPPASPTVVAVNVDQSESKQ